MRKSLFPIIVFVVGIIFIARLFYLQIYSTTNYDIYEDNAIRKVFTYPKRGYIYDRNKILLVSNQPSYDVMIIPREVRELDTLEFCSLLKISKDYLITKYEKTSKYSTRIPSVFLAHLSKENYGYLSEKIRKYKGFYIQKRNLREYNTTIGALGAARCTNRPLSSCSIVLVEWKQIVNASVTCDVLLPAVLAFRGASIPQATSRGAN